MILTRDLDTKKTRIETRTTSLTDSILESEIKGLGLKPTHTPSDTFRKYYLGDFDKGILPLLQTKEVNSFEDSNKQYKELLTIFQDRTSNNNHIRANISLEDQKLFDRMKNKIDKPNLYLQKLTYETETNEDIDKIIDSLKNQSSNSMFRTIHKNDDNSFSVYSSSFGLWDINGNKFFRQVEPEGNLKIKNNAHVRFLGDLNREMKDLSKTNFVINEDLNTLFSEKLINGMRVLSETQDGIRPSPIYRDYHLKKTLTEDDYKRFEIDQSVQEQDKKEKTHVNKKDTIKSEVTEEIKKNESKPHIQYELNKTHSKTIVEDNEILKQKDLMMKEYNETLLKELEKKQKIELEKLKLDIENSKIEVKEAKFQFYKALENGANFDEASDIVRSNKYSDITVQSVLQDVKAELLLSKNKDTKIDTIKQERDVYVEESKSLKSELGKLKAIIKDKDEELNSKVEQLKLKEEENEELNNKINTSNLIINKYKEILVSLKDEILELKSENKEMKEEYESIIKDNEEELSTLEKTIEENNNIISSLKSTIDEMTVDYSELETENERMSKIIQLKDMKIESLEKSEESLTISLTQKDNTISSLSETLQESTKEIKELRETLKSTVDEMTVDNGNLEVENENQSEIITQRDTTIDKLENDIEHFKENLGKPNINNEDFSKIIDTLKLDNDRMRKELEERKETEHDDEELILTDRVVPTLIRSEEEEDTSSSTSHKRHKKD